MFASQICGVCYAVLCCGFAVKKIFHAVSNSQCDLALSRQEWMPRPLGCLSDCLSVFLFLGCFVCVYKPGDDELAHRPVLINNEDTSMHHRLRA